MAAILMVDTARAGWPVVAVSDALVALTRTPAAALVDRPWPPLWDAEEDRAALAELTAAVGRGAAASVGLPSLRGDGSRFASMVDVVPGVGPGGPVVLCTVHVDGAPDDDRWLAYHDALTGLPNRRLLDRDLDIAISRAEREGRTVAVIYIDLDRFKLVNDSYGHAAGDRVLCVVAERLRAEVRAHDLIARLGGDEFAIVLTDLEDDPRARAGRVAAHLQARLAEPIPVEGGTARIGGSVGIGVYPEHGAERGTVVAAADAGMYRQKRLGQTARRRADAEPAVPALWTRARLAVERAKQLRTDAERNIDTASAAVGRRRDLEQSPDS